MKKIISVFMIFICITIFSSCGKKELPEVKSMDNILPEPMGYNISLTEDAVIENNIPVIEINRAAFDGEMGWYYAKTHYETDPLYEWNVYRKFGFTPFDKMKDDLSDDYSSMYGNIKGKNIEFKKADSSFSYRNTKNFGSITDKERLDALGEQKLKELGLMPEDYCRNGSVELSSGSYIPSYGPRFAQKIDGKRVFGAGNVSIQFNSEDEIVWVNRDWLQPERVGTVKTMSFDKIYSLIGNNDRAMVACELYEPVDRVEYASFTLGYYLDTDYKYYVPVCRFEGVAHSGSKSATIWAYVIAIENLTDDIIIDK